MAVPTAATDAGGRCPLAPPACNANAARCSGSATRTGTPFVVVHPRGRERGLHEDIVRRQKRHPFEGLVPDLDGRVRLFLTFRPYRMPAPAP